MIDKRSISRRSVLRIAAAMSAGSVATFLAACGGSTAGGTPSAPAATTSAATSGAATRPPATPGANAISATIPATIAAGSASAVSGVPAADGRIVASVPGVPDAYLKPPPSFVSVKAVPGRGGKVATLQVTNNAPPLPHDQNKFWQELEKRLGLSSLDATFVPSPSYRERLSAITAGGDLPDLVFLDLDSAPEQSKVILQGAYTDLTSYLTGDSLKEFPNLAAYPMHVWKNAQIKGKLYGVPRYLDNGPPLMIMRGDWAQQADIPQPRTADDLFNLLVTFTKNDPDGNGKPDTFGLGTIALDFFIQVFRAPNNWRLNPDGTLTKDIETDEYRMAVVFMRKLFDAGAYHPDAATTDEGPQARNPFLAGKVGSVTGTYTGIKGASGLRARLKKVNPQGDAIGLVPFGFDGGAAVAHATTGFAGYVGIPAKNGKDTERVKELLRICDYFAAPTFSVERDFLDYGIDGRDNTVQPDGSRIKTDQGVQETTGFANLNSGVRLFYYPDRPADAPYIQKLVADYTKISIPDPTNGAFSQTAYSKAAELAQLQRDRIGAIVFGRDPMSAYDQYVKDWRSRGGDQSRKEYEASLKGN